MINKVKASGILIKLFPFEWDGPKPTKHHNPSFVTSREKSPPKNNSD